MARNNGNLCTWKGIEFKSHFEMEVAQRLDKLGLEWSYEPCKLPRKPVKAQTATYTPDFLVTLRDGSSFFLETKGYFYKDARDKMEEVFAANPDLDLRFLFMNAKQKLSAKAKKRPTTYAMWCEKRGFTYASGTFPNEWRTPIGKTPKKKKKRRGKATTKTVYMHILKLLGLDNQINILMEECGEIITAANHWRRGRISFNEFLEECVDAQIVINQMRSLEPKTFEALYKKKLTRLVDRVNSGSLEKL